MALILDFNEHASKACGGSTRVSFDGSAEIVIFPGVRYERWSDRTGERADRRVTERDRLELPE